MTWSKELLANEYSKEAVASAVSTLVANRVKPSLNLLKETLSGKSLQAPSSAKYHQEYTDDQDSWEKCNDNNIYERFARCHSIDDHLKLCLEMMDFYGPDQPITQAWKEAFQELTKAREMYMEAEIKRRAEMYTRKREILSMEGA
jgi:hypothetical protein